MPLWTILCKMVLIGAILLLTLFIFCIAIHFGYKLFDAMQQADAGVQDYRDPNGRDWYDLDE